MLRKIIFGLSAFTFAVAAQADWKVSSTNSDYSVAKTVEHRHVVMSNEVGAEATLEIAVFSAKTATVHVFDQPSAPRAELAEVMQREHAVAGVNGGYFDPDDAPVGLVIEGGKMISPLRKARLLSGVMTVASARVQLLRLPEYSPRRNATTALQCGPFLVDGARPVPGLNDTRGARRSFVAVSGERVAIGYCSNATLSELGQMLASSGIIGEAKIQRAMNLDGGSSSGFWFDGGARPLSIPEQKTVRNFVAVVAK